MLALGIGARLRAGDRDGRVDAVEQRGRHVVVALSWSDAAGRRQRWAHLLTVRGGRVVAMRDYKRPSGASAVARALALVPRRGLPA